MGYFTRSYSEFCEPRDASEPLLVCSLQAIFNGERSAKAYTPTNQFQRLVLRHS